MITLRRPSLDDLQAASDLCLRSKAFWGYDATFMAACVAELTLTEADISGDPVTLAFYGDELAGVAHVSNDKDECYLEKLFVDPAHMAKGVGRLLFEWSRSAACELGVRQMIIEADPDAVPFYLAMGCRKAGSAPSSSISGRMLPRLICDTDAKGALV